MNHMVNGQAGSLAMLEYAAHTLGRRWVVTLEMEDVAPRVKEATK